MKQNTYIQQIFCQKGPRSNNLVCRRRAPCDNEYSLSSSTRSLRPTSLLVWRHKQHTSSPAKLTRVFRMDFGFFVSFGGLKLKRIETSPEYATNSATTQYTATDDQFNLSPINSLSIITTVGPKKISKCIVTCSSFSLSAPQHFCTAADYL